MFRLKWRVERGAGLCLEFQRHSNAVRCYEELKSMTSTVEVVLFCLDAPIRRWVRDVRGQARSRRGNVALNLYAGGGD